MIGERPKQRRAWLIARRGGGTPRELLTLNVGGEKALPVFSFEEEAVLYLDFSGLGVAWRAVGSETSDLVSLLDSRSDVPLVSLDPFPEVGLQGLNDLVSLPREEFVALLVDREDGGGQNSDARPTPTARIVNF